SVDRAGADIAKDDPERTDEKRSPHWIGLCPSRARAGPALFEGNGLHAPGTSCPIPDRIGQPADRSLRSLTCRRSSGSRPSLLGCRTGRQSLPQIVTAEFAASGWKLGRCRFAVATRGRKKCTSQALMLYLRNVRLRMPRLAGSVSARRISRVLRTK